MYTNNISYGSHRQTLMGKEKTEEKRREKEKMRRAST